MGPWSMARSTRRGSLRYCGSAVVLIIAQLALLFCDGHDVWGASGLVASPRRSGALEPARRDLHQTKRNADSSGEASLHGVRRNGQGSSEVSLRECTAEETELEFLSRATGDPALLRLLRDAGARGDSSSCVVRSFANRPSSPWRERSALIEELARSSSSERGSSNATSNAASAVGGGGGGEAESREPKTEARNRVRAPDGGVHRALVHFIVHQSTSDWCARPCNSPSWELAVPKLPKLQVVPRKRENATSSSKYRGFEVAIWQQLGRISAYEFDATFEKKAKNAYTEVCAGIGWACAAYGSFREQYAVPGCPSIAIARDFAEASGELATKLGRMFDCLREISALGEISADTRGGSSDTRRAAVSSAALTYLGHGSDADGSLFESALERKDGVRFVRAQDFAVLNFGTNCEEGRWGMVAAFAPRGQGKSRFILASDLEVGGTTHF